MAWLHKRSLKLWQRFLRSRQDDRTERDIRADVLAMANDTISIGYPASNIERSYAREMRRVFPKLLAYDRDGRAWRKARRFLAIGAIHDSPGPSHPGLARVLMLAEPDQIILFEQGFLASAYSWIVSYETHLPVAACLGYVYDDLAYYFMADYPNRLIERLNSGDELSSGEIARSEQVMKRVRTCRLSKYNDQPIQAPAMTSGYPRRVLVVDQSYADASTVWGRINPSGFDDMLAAAISENPDAEILVKTHPDTVARPNSRGGYYTSLEERPGLRLVRMAVNPYSLFEEVDTVYVGTSQMGVEALIAGKRVVCFGSPFYAGWGLTDDRQVIPHRCRRRSLVDLFHFFYIWYTIYNVPDKSSPSQIEDAMDFIEANRPSSPTTSGRE